MYNQITKITTKNTIIMKRFLLLTAVALFITTACESDDMDYEVRDISCECYYAERSDVNRFIRNYSIGITDTLNLKNPCNDVLVLDSRKTPIQWVKELEELQYNEVFGPVSNQYCLSREYYNK